MHILITAGPTREFFDSVRFISNPSSGKMGVAIASAAARRGHRISLVLGPVELPDPSGVEVIRVTTAQEMFDACAARFESCDGAIMTAAVCDYRPVERLPHKLKKANEPRVVALEPTRDICATLGAKKSERIMIGFAMEDHDERGHAESKLRRKNCDAIVLNGLNNVGSDDAEIHILRADSGWSDTQVGTKAQMAEVIVDLFEDLAK